MYQSKRTPRRAQFKDRASTFVSAEPQRHDLATVPPLAPGPLLPPTTYVGHAHQDDNAMTHAASSLLVSAAYIIAAGMITLGLLLIIWLFRGLGDGWATYTFTGLVVWGVCTLAALWGNRRQSLHHSATGIAHHEISSRERIALHAIDTHADLLLARWRIDQDDE